MNAVSPPGLKADARRKAVVEEGVRLTIELDEADERAAAETTPPQAGASAPGAGPAGRRKPAQQPEAAAPPRSAGAAAPAMPAQLAAIEVTLSVEVGSRMIPLRELLEVEPGQLFALDRMTNEPVTILVNGKAFAHGEIVAIGERFGVRLLDILPSGAG